ncbi:MAG: hypothetical protein A2W11_00975 [Ignavibacteria bacterium RBG_16_35_7]|nr:MAG: hypothetical protein A2W11_00975 [Ignavibacteria bacterium RBG_16_35_7]
MKTLIKLLGIITLVVLLNNGNSLAQQSGGKVYWMVTVEVSLGKLAEYHSFNGNELEPLMESFGYKPVASWQTIVGDIEEVIFVAEFESMAAYYQARVNLLGSDEWKTASRKFDALTKSVHTRFLSATSYSRLQ